MSKTKIPASVFVIARDAEAHLRRALQSVTDFAEIIVVVDSRSRDATWDIAFEFTGHVYKKKWLGFSGQKAYALSLCQYDWVLNLDADEEVSRPLCTEMRKTVEDGQVVALKIPFDDRFLFRCNHPWVKRVSKVRFFQKHAGSYGTEAVHEGVHIIEGSVRDATGAIIHYGETSVELKLEKNNQYSSLRAQQDFQAGKRPSILKVFLAYPVGFLRAYILRRECMNGISGFITSQVNGFYAFLKAAKLYEYSLLSKRDSTKK